MALAGLPVDPDVVPEAGAVPERLGADRAGELDLGVRQALGEFKCPKSGVGVFYDLETMLLKMWFRGFQQIYIYPMLDKIDQLYSFLLENTNEHIFAISNLYLAEKSCET